MMIIRRLFLFVILITMMVQLVDAASPTASPSSVRSSLNNIYTLAGSDSSSSTGTGGVATASSLYYPRSVWLDTNNVVYVVESTARCVRKFSYPNGIVSKSVGVCGSNTVYSGDNGAATAAILSPTALTINTAGTMYVSSCDNNRVYMVSTASVITSILGIGTSGTSPAANYGDGGAGTSAQIYCPYGLWLSTQNNIYISTYNAGLIRMMTSGNIVLPVAGVTSGFNGDGGQATSAYFSHPERIFVDSSGVIYIGDSSNQRVRRISTAGIISTVIGSGSSTFTTGVPATSNGLNYPTGVVVDSSNGDIYVSSSSSHRVCVMNGVDGLLNAYVNTAGTNAFSGDEGAATAAQINKPDGLYLDLTGKLFIADSNNNRIRVVYSVSPSVSPTRSPTTTPSTIRSSLNNMYTIVGTGTSSSSGTNGAPTAANINIPSSVWFDSNGVFYWVESSGFCVRKYSFPSGTVSDAVGVCGSSAQFYGNGVAATSALLNNPIAIGVNTMGTIFISDYVNNRVRRVPSNQIITTILGLNGGASDTGDGGASTAATILSPSGIWLDTTGQLYVSTIGNGLVRAVSTSSIVTLIAGSSSGYTGDGAQATSTSMGCKRLYVDSLGVIYLGDSGNGRLRQVPSSGIVTTLIGGTGSLAYNGENLPGTSVNLDYPTGVVVDTSNGDIYINNVHNCRVQVLTKTTSLVTTFAGSGNPSWGGDGGAATSASLRDPDGSFLSPSGLFFIGDNLNNRVRLVYSVTPTQQPTYSFAPSFTPTVVPTIVPTVLPTVLPSLKPTLLPTIQPTIAPSIIPTISPTVLPTAVPTIMPTIVPTTQPTVTPSVVPSISPSVVPTIQPTFIPTNIPTDMPTVLPTVKPSVLPTVAPSIASTVIPTVIPSILPTVNPSVTPSTIPSVVPTIGPTLAPSVLPTVSPSVLPTVSPSVNPTLVPTVMPSVVPSVSPTILPSPNPSIAPSVSPTVNPSGYPTVSPTILSSNNPTEIPTILPSVSPSIISTIDPSALPTIMPTPCQSIQPTVRPSVLPTAVPSTMPSVEPSAYPSVVPSVSPSVYPTEVPTMVPSVLPTMVPSNVPSCSPTIGPSFEPSKQPTTCPTACPSIGPSYVPTNVPTTLPTLAPSLCPTTTPTVHPTVEPSKFPSIIPTITPTHAPVPPSVHPTILPTELPSVNPSISPSVVPSVGPSYMPSHQPSTMPSIYPTTAPSVGPTIIHSILPTHEPSASPTVSPSVVPSLFPTQKPSIAPSAVPTVIPTSARPTIIPTTSVPTLTPTTLEYYNSHPKATLPNNQSISIVGLMNQKFQIVLPFFSATSGSSGTAFSDIELQSGSMDTVYRIVGNTSMSSLSVDSSLVSIYYGFLALDSAKRSVSILDDINGDNYADLIIGDPYAAKCYVMFGTSNGLTEMTNGFTIFGEKDGDLTCWSVSGAGDVNNDTIKDIIIGAPFANKVGAVYVIYGKRVMFDVYLNNLTSSQGFAIYGSQKSDYLGISVSGAGDVNKDGCDDIVMGAVLTANYLSGSAYVIYGERHLTSFRLTQLSFAQGFKVTGLSYMYAGYSVSGAGDLNNDGYHDIIIGSHPVKPSMPLSSYVIFGEASITSNLVLSSLTSSQGFQIIGSGSIVAVVSSPTSEFSEILVSSNVDYSDNVGIIVYSDLDSLTAMTQQPAAQPTVSPTVRRSTEPSLKPSRQPVVNPTQRPSDAPTYLPSAPTNAPVVGFIEPSAEPSQNPTITTADPSIEPSESPTVIPTFEPTEYPSMNPSTMPSIEPTRNPSVIPTFAVTSAAPSEASLTRSPFGNPTVLPTIQTTTAPIVIVLNSSTSHSGIVFNHTSLSDSIHYVINVTGVITIAAPSNGVNSYSIVPQSNTSRLILTNFNTSTDVIDLSRFHVDDWSKLNITTIGASVVIKLSNGQDIVIENIDASDLSRDNFVVSQQSSSPDNSEDVDVVLNNLGIIISIAVIIALVAGCGVYYCRKKQQKSKDIINWKEKYIGSYLTTIDGEYIETDSVDDGATIDEDEDSLDISMDSDISAFDNLSVINDKESENEVGSDELLSDHTIDSNGDFIERV